MADNKTPDQDNLGDDVQSDSRDGQSRRAFLKAAVVGSAAVAAVGGASAAGLALTHKAPLNTLRFAGVVALVSPNDPCAVCTTGTNPNNLVDQDTFNNSESLFLWVRFINVPAGSYTVEVTPTIQSSTASCNTSAPLQYQAPQKSVDSWILNAGGRACHPATYAELGTPTQTDAFPVSFTIASTKDLMMAAHLQNACPNASNNLVITATLKSGDTTVMQCSHTITINAKPSH